MIDSGEEAHFWRSHRVVLREEQFKLEATSGIRRLLGAHDDDRKKPGIRIARDSANTGDGLVLESIGLL